MGKVPPQAGLEQDSSPIPPSYANYQASPGEKVYITGFLFDVARPDNPLSVQSFGEQEN